MQTIANVPPGTMLVWSNDDHVKNFQNDKMVRIIDKMMRHHKACSLIIADRFELAYYRTLIEKNVELNEIEKDVLITGFLQYADAEGCA